MNTREKLLALVFDLILCQYASRVVMEHDSADYALRQRQHGNEIARWSFNGSEFVREEYSRPFSGFRYRWFFFHIDEANNRAMVSSRGGAMSGRGCIIDVNGEILSYWRS